MQVHYLFPIESNILASSKPRVFTPRVVQGLGEQRFLCLAPLLFLLSLGALPSPGGIAIFGTAAFALRPAARSSRAC